MLSTLALMAGLFAGPAQADGLSLADPQFTYGIFGPPRKSARLLPGDNLIVSFDILGISTDASGKARYSIATELSDAKGKVWFRQVPREQSVVLSLGGGRLPAFAQVDVGLDQPAGDYKLKVTVKDLAADKSASLTRDFTVLPRGFGVVRFSGSRDPDNQLPTFRPVAGQTIWMHLSVVGFERAKTGGQPDVTFEVQILDDKGKATTAKPLSVTVNKDVPEKAAALPLQFPVVLNRPGQFTIKLKVSDKVSGKSIDAAAPFVVLSHR